MFKYRFTIGRSSNELLTMLTKSVGELRMLTFLLVAAGTNLPVVMALKKREMWFGQSETSEGDPSCDWLARSPAGVHKTQKH